MNPGNVYTMFLFNGKQKAEQKYKTEYEQKAQLLQTQITAKENELATQKEMLDKRRDLLIDKEKQVAIKLAKKEEEVEEGNYYKSMVE
jgi:hypothetical protein